MARGGGGPTHRSDPLEIAEERGKPRGRRRGGRLLVPSVCAAAAGVLLSGAQLFSMIPRCLRQRARQQMSGPAMSGRSGHHAGRRAAGAAVPQEATDQLTTWAETLLKEWDTADRANRREGNAPFGLWQSGEIPEVEKLRAAVRYLVKQSRSVRLGIMAGNGPQAVQAMKSWSGALQLPSDDLHLRTLDARGKATDKDFTGSPVYVKYSYVVPSSDTPTDADAYITPHIGKTRGVTVYPELPDGELRIYGDFPLALFEGAEGASRG